MPHIDSEHRGPLIEVASLITLVATILLTASKVATKWRMLRKLQNDDIFMILALVGSLMLIQTLEARKHCLILIYLAHSCWSMRRCVITGDVWFGSTRRALDCSTVGPIPEGQRQREHPSAFFERPNKVLL